MPPSTETKSPDCKLAAALALPLILIVVSPEVTALDLRESVTVKLDEKAADEAQMETLPELYKDLAWVDEKTGLTWLPTTINETGIGMVFANGPSAQNWGWAAVKSILIPEEDRKNHPIPGKPGEFMKHKMDMANMKVFPERDYIEALDYIGVFESSLASKK